MMKKFSVFALLAAMALPAVAATNSGTRAASSVDLTSGPATRTREKVNYEKYQTRSLTKTYESKDAGDLYYAKPANRSALYKQYAGANSSSARATKTTTRTTRSEVLRSELKRKYFLAHPFFQPLKGKFGSVTDFGYASMGYDVKLPSTESGLFDGAGNAISFNGVGGDWKYSQFAIKEDFSFGITDRIALMAMAQYDTYESEYDWDLGSSDKMDDSGLNLYGIGAQWRFADTEKWIGMASGLYQRQKDISNNFALELKAGYKVSSSTIYGVLRGWYMDFDGEVYGNGVSGTDSEGYDSILLLSYSDNQNPIYVEGGLGVFSVLNQDWTLNAELTLGDYDWMNQASIKGAIGWQPNDWFALNLYAKASIYSSADGKDVDTYYYRSGTFLDNAQSQLLTGIKNIGKSELDKYSEMSVGLQAIFMF